MRSTTVVLSCILVAMGGSSLAMEDVPSPPSHALGVVGFQGIEEPPEKRAYTYVSEYKRLPIYNFGLGKRWGALTDEDKRARLYSFGLGKRARPYSFGLGKRGSLQYQPMSMSYLPEQNYENLAQEPLDDIFGEKRSRLYSFGLGKRFSADGAELGLGKRPSEDFGQRYMFGLGKRVADEEDTTP